MNEKDFEELLESVKEVGLMEKGEISPSREFVVENHLSGNSSNVKNSTVALQNRLEDAEDLLDLGAAQKEEANAPTVSLSELEKEFGIK